MAAVILNYLFPGKVFMYLISVAVIAAVISWVTIIVVNLKFRKAKAGQNIEFKTPLHPYSNYFCLAFMALIVVLMTQMDDMKMAVYILPVWLLILWVGFKVKKSFGGKQKESRNIV